MATVLALQKRAPLPPKRPKLRLVPLPPDSNERFQPRFLSREEADRLIVENMDPARRYVRSILFDGKTMQQFINERGMDMHDFYSAAYEGLINAAQRFDPSRGIPFFGYAHWWVRQSVLSLFRRFNTSFCGLDNNVHTELRAKKTVVRLYADHKGRPPMHKVHALRDQSKCAARLLAKVKKDRSFLRILEKEIERTESEIGRANHAASLDAPSPSGIPYIRFIPDARSWDTVDALFEAEKPLLLERLLFRLPERERWVMQQQLAGVSLRDLALQMKNAGHNQSKKRDHVSFQYIGEVSRKAQKKLQQWVAEETSLSD